MDITLQVSGTTMVWSAEFRSAMEQLCLARGLPPVVPACLISVTLKPEARVLLWPGRGLLPDGHAVRVSPAGRRVTNDLAEPLASLNVDLPEGIVIEVPVFPYTSPHYGPCLALHFPKATFLYRRSRASAIGRQDEQS